MAASETIRALRQLARGARQPARHACELCSVTLSPSHAHLWETAPGRLRCACAACALLFEGQSDKRFQRVVDHVEWLGDLPIEEADWTALQIPVALAFLYRSGRTGRAMAGYPGPGGVTEWSLPGQAWEALVAKSPIFSALAPDVEAILVDRRQGSSRSVRLSIDHVYQLTAVVRRHWQGLSGGAALQREIEAFFSDLRRKADRTER